MTSWIGNAARAGRAALALTLAAAVTSIAAAQAPPGPRAPGAAGDAAVTSAEVKAAVENAVLYLKSQQQMDGSWPYPKPDHMQGAAALAVLALSEAGLPEDDPAIRKGLEYVLSRGIQGTYDAACAALAIASVNPGRHLRELAQLRDYLTSTQLPNGMWAYSAGTVDRSGGDNSNTQFAMLGLNAVMSVGLAVSPETLRLANQHYTRTQNADGGWGYRPGDGSYGAMTAAGTAALNILGARLFMESQVCGQFKSDPRIASGFSWLARNFTVRANPGIDNSWVLYYLYALERVGVLTGERFLAGHDWYMEGARVLVDAQNRNGSWMSGGEVVPNTCFALLFLSKGNVPVLINKLAHAPDWNVDPHDAANLTRFISANFGQQVGWQTVTMNDSVETLLAAPILYITGHQFPQFSDAELAKLGAFFENGGFLLAEACCGSKDFDAGFRRFVDRLFPGYPMEPLDSAHAAYNLVFNVRRIEHPLYGIDAGCRTTVIYSPRDLSCSWEKNNLAEEADAFYVGANIAAYVTGKERLAPRLEQVKAVSAPQAVTAAPTAFALARVKYAGTWNPHPAGDLKLLEFLNDKAGLYVSARPVSVTLTDPNLANYPFLYLTGPNSFALSDAEKAALREFLERGGFLFADATSGRRQFDESFRAMMKDVLPDSPLEPIPPDSPLYHIAFNTTHVTYSAAVRETSPNLDTLTLYGAKVDDRIAVAYSPYDIGCALERYPAFGSRGLIPEDAFKAAANIVMYALTY